MSLDTRNNQPSSRRSFLVTALFGITLSGCHRALEEKEEKQLNNGERGLVKRIINATQDRRLQVLLLEVLTTPGNLIHRGNYFLEKLPGEGMQVYSSDRKINFSYTSDGYLKNHSSTPLSLGEDLGKVLAVLETAKDQ